MCMSKKPGAGSLLRSDCSAAEKKRTGRCEKRVGMDPACQRGRSASRDAYAILPLRIDLFTPPVPSFTSGHLIPTGRTDA